MEIEIGLGIDGFKKQVSTVGTNLDCFNLSNILNSLDLNRLPIYFVETSNPNVFLNSLFYKLTVAKFQRSQIILSAR
jgi:hypothetical protein